MTTGATILSGGEYVGVGMRAAGIDHLWGIEWDDRIAQCARANGFNTITADVMTVDPHSLTVPDILHASPVCTRASLANSNRGEQQIDIDAGIKTAEFIDVLRPRIFTLENVYQYRKFEAFRIIEAALNRNGYWVHWDNLCAADYGVPQTRRRLILRAVRDGMLPPLPAPVEWTGWYSGIQDLLTTLPPAQFANWQLKRLPKFYSSMLVDEQTGTRINGERRLHNHRLAEDPSLTVRAICPPKAFLVQGDNSGNHSVPRSEDAPAYVVTNANKKPHASLAGCVVAMHIRAMSRFQSVSRKWSMSG